MSSNDEISVVHKIKDADLVFLVRIINKTHSSIGLTLFINGLVITGQLISGKTYYDFVSERMREAGEVGVVLSQYFTDSANKVYSPPEAEEAPTTFLHLKDVKMSTYDGHLNPLHGAYMRFKIEEVNGHVIGTMS